MIRQFYRIRFFLVTLIAISVLFSSLILTVSRVNAQQSAYSFWSDLANNAWNYFQPGVGIEQTTGLPKACLNYPYFTDWDTALYLQAILDAEKLGILSSAGTWGSNERINKLLTFLETRSLNINGMPYLFYSTATQNNIDSSEQSPTDTGKLLIALKNTENQKPELKNKIDFIVNNRTNYENARKAIDSLLPDVLSGNRPLNIYDFYVTSGFAGFWPQRYTKEADSLLQLLVTAPKIDYNGVSLPKAKLSSDPLLYSILDLNSQDPRLLNLTRQVYLAHEIYYNKTGNYRAFGEISSGSYADYFYEWVTMPDGRMWILQAISWQDRGVDLSIKPIVCFKVAVGFLALYNSPFAQNMTNYLLAALPKPTNGYVGGSFEGGGPIDNDLGVGNGLIVSAARYAIANQGLQPGSTPTPTVWLPESTNSDMTANSNNDQNNKNSSQLQPEPTTSSSKTTPIINPTQISIGEQSSEYLILLVVIVSNLAIITGGLIYAKTKKEHQADAEDN